MASGCIFGKCPVCGELVWEDDWFMDDNGKMYHQKCHALREFGSLNVAEKLDDIEESIEALMEMNKSYQSWFNQQIQRLKDEVNFEKKKVGGAADLEDRCVVCGEVVPEGRQVCPNCVEKYMEEPWRREISMDKTVLNGSGCVDKVAHDAINNVIREEKAKEKKMHDREEAAETLIKTLKNTVWLSGFKLIGRIQLEDPKTGRKYL